MRPAGDGGPAWRAAPPPAEDVALLSGLTALAVLALAWSWPLWGDALELVCPFRTLTGIPCPTCGGTRALLAAASGDFRAAVQLNPMVGLAATGLLAWIPLSCAWVVGRWPRPEVRRLVPVSGRIVARAGGILVLGNWLWVAFSGTV